MISFKQFLLESKISVKDIDDALKDHPKLKKSINGNNSTYREYVHHFEDNRSASVSISRHGKVSSTIEREDNKYSCLYHKDHPPHDGTREGIRKSVDIAVNHIEKHMNSDHKTLKAASDRSYRDKI